jgi:hypothetical protein
MPLISRLNTAKKQSIINDLVCVAGEPGFEPGLTESESVGLPLTYSPAGLGAGRVGGNMRRF